MKGKGLTEVRILGVATYIQTSSKLTFKRLRLGELLKFYQRSIQFPRLFGVGKKFEEKLPYSGEKTKE